jgi:hypothetical protein
MATSPDFVDYSSANKPSGFPQLSPATAEEPGTVGMGQLPREALAAFVRTVPGVGGGGDGSVATDAVRTLNGRRNVVVAGRLVWDEAGWRSDFSTGNRSINVESVAVVPDADNKAGVLRIEYGGLAGSSIVSMVAVPDEVLSDAGITVGVTASKSRADFRLTLTGKAYSDKIGITPGGGGLRSDSGVFKVAYNETTGIITLTHPELPAGQEDAVSIETINQYGVTATLAPITSPLTRTAVSIQLAESEVPIGDFIEYDTTTNTWKSKNGVFKEFYFSAGTLQFLHPYILGDQRISITDRGPFRATVATAASPLDHTITKISFYDAAGNIVLTPGPNTRFYLERGGIEPFQKPINDLYNDINPRFFVTHGDASPKRVFPTDLPSSITTAQRAGIWVFGIVELPIETTPVNPGAFPISNGDTLKPSLTSTSAPTTLVVDITKATAPNTIKRSI